jgi:uncharacterized membrane protein YtjA (UPF0391 family)
VSVIAALIGFGDNANGVALYARIVFFIFFGLFVGLLIVGRRRVIKQANERV